MDAYAENDKRAFSFVERYISKAKSEKNNKRLIKGYEHAIYYSSNVNEKLIYADSAISTALKNDDADLISRAYLGKGIIYYYNRRQYKPALDYYINAFQYSKNSSDDYLKNKIIYHLGMVKSYLGYYNEAAKHFTESARYFEIKLSDSSHPNLKLNYETGYLNSIYRLSTCYKNLHQFAKEDSLITLGLSKLNQINQHPLEFGYFQKGKGIQLLRNGNSNDAFKYLTTAQKLLNDQQDYASLTTVYFYMGKLYSMKNDRERSLTYFKRVDSLLNKFWFVTPEIRSNYVYLINDAKRYANADRQLYYMDQLLKTDSIITADFATLSSKVYQEYDTEALIQDKNSVIKRLNRNVFLLYLFSALLISSAIYFFWKFSRREKYLTNKYQELSRKYTGSNDDDRFLTISSVNTPEKSYYSPEVTEDIKKKLKIFESKKLFLKPSLTIMMVAKMIDSNRTHLSYVLNEQLGMSFPLYIKTLRIEYITKKIMADHKYLQYKVDTLAEECGIANRQLFSNHFFEITGMRPMEFIRKRREALEKENKI